MHRMPKMLIAVAFTLSIGAIPAQANVFLTVAQDGVDKIRSKPIAYKPSLEFKQAVARYIKNTDTHFFQAVQRTADENVSYKKELQYLFKNYSKLSSPALLSRLRSAHQTMVKTDTNVNGEAYKKYEQICSALLLTCTQVFFNDVRNQILNALHEIDTLMVYWRYQQNHQLKYFFSKSPVKWIVGKEQGKEIAHNVMRLERKQAELYTLLGALTGHIHSFTEVGLTSDDCYAWIEQLFEIVPCIKVSSDNGSDGSRFDTIAATLGLKNKRVSSFKNDCLASIAAARKPNHFIRHWLKYTTSAAVLAYLIHYNAKNPEVMRSIASGAQNEASKFLTLLLHPLKQIYERGKLAFSDEKKVDEPKKEISDNKDKESIDPIDRDAQLLELTKKLVEVGSNIPSDHAAIIARSNADLRKGALDDMREVVRMLKDPKDGWIWSSSYEFDEKKISESIDKIEKIVVPMKIENIITNKKELDEYKDAFKVVKGFIAQFKKDAACTIEGLYIKGSLNKAEVLLTIDEDYLNTLLGYLEIIEQRIIPIFEFIVDIAENIIAQFTGLIKKADALEIQVMQQLKDHELTLMFTSLIPLGITGFGLSKVYEWITTRDYSSIRIALSDVNGLLIEAANNLDDHDYGKLVYLICKLKNRAMYLKDSMTDEFLADVAKLESKQYSAHIKRGIVENMFNKYAFLGRVAIA
jgi:hypothetical protein